MLAGKFPVLLLRSLFRIINVSISPEKLFERTFILSEHDSGIVSIQKGHRKLKIDLGFLIWLEIGASVLAFINVINEKLPFALPPIHALFMFRK